MARVALILPNLGLGGAEKVALALAAGFADRRHSVDLVLLQAEGALLGSVPAGCRVVDLQALRIRSAITPLARYFRSERPDTVQAFMWPVTVAAVVARALAGQRFPLALSDHTTISEHYAHFGKIKKAVLATSIRAFYPLADARITVSEGAAEDLRRLGKLSDVAVIRNPVLSPTPVPDPSEEVVALWRGRRRLLAVGNQTPAKDYPTLLRALALLPEDFALVIVGEPRMQPALEELTAALGIEDRVHFAGMQVNPWPFYAAADLFVLSSQVEGYSIVLVEALLAGLPVVSTDCPSGPREVLAGGQFGALVPVGDPAALAEAIIRVPVVDRVIQSQRGKAISGMDAVADYARMMQLA